MIENCRYNPRKDNNVVYPNLSIDLEAALRTGVVKDSGTAVEFNGIEDPNLIRFRVSDTFQAIDERNSVVNKELTRIKTAQSEENQEK